jgi:hypothetical protein
MKVLLTVFAFVLVLFLIPSAQAQERVCFYEHSNFKGKEECVSSGATLEVKPFSEKIAGKLSSLKVPPGWQIVYFENADGSGGQCTFFGEVNYVGDGCNDWAKAYTFTPQTNEIRKAALKQQRNVCIFNNDDLTGDHACGGLGNNLAHLSDDLNDDVESISIADPNLIVVLYKHDQFREEMLQIPCGRYIISGDDDDNVSSLKVFYTPQAAQSCPGSDGDLAVPPLGIEYRTDLSE